MDVELSYLEDYLREELAGYRGLRIRVVTPSGTARSVDLEQNYNASTGTIHKRTGVLIMTDRSEYFFPREWITQTNLSALIHQQIEQIRDDGCLASPRGNVTPAPIVHR